MDGGEFALHQRLGADTAPLGDLPLCRVLLMDNAAWPWIVLVPRRPALREFHDLPAPDRAALMEEIAAASKAMAALPGTTKVNVGMLGNIVSQLHIHVVARREGDLNWPGPVWGFGSPARYAPGARDRLAASVREGLGL
jgi:diadenosine tetraphosphate (Ap4A) HIT family hydrolase